MMLFRDITIFLFPRLQLANKHDKRNILFSSQMYKLYQLHANKNESEKQI